MRTFFFKMHRTIRLRSGQSVLLICGFFRKIRRINLKHGEFVRVTCDASGKTITVVCDTKTTSRGTIHLKLGEALIVRCRRHS